MTMIIMQFLKKKKIKKNVKHTEDAKYVMK